LATLVYRLAFRTFEISEAASLSVMMIALLLIVGAGYHTLSRRRG
jgi:hypothetical protein